MTPEDLLAKHNIKLESTAPGRYYTTCPRCSANRQRHNQDKKCLGVTIEDDGARWGCNNCGWTGPEKGSGDRSNGKGRKGLLTYVYRDADGNVCFRKVRNLPGREPRFWLEQPDGHGGWRKGTKGANGAKAVDTSIVYRADEVARAIADSHTIACVEGEKDADSLWALGIAATCNAHGATDVVKNPKAKPKWYRSHSEQLRGADIVVFNDNDATGYAHAEVTAHLSHGIAKRVRRLDLAEHWPEIPKGGDVSDWLAAGHDGEELLALIERAPDFVTATERSTQEQPKAKAATICILPSPSAPLEVVRCFVEEQCLRNGAPEELTLRYWNGGWWNWRTTHWLEVKEQRVRQWLYRFTDGASYYDAEDEVKPWSPNRRKVGDLLDALNALIYVPEEIEEQPCWLDGRDDGGGPFVSCANGLLDVSTQELHPHSPLFFNQTSVPFDYDPLAPSPTKFLAFLNELWPPSKDGKENSAIAALGEWFGYVVSGRTDLHKILLMVGPTRGGKGTIARILSALIGKRNTCGPTLNSLGTEFGLAPLIGKSLAVISDVRFTGRNAGVVVERLLSISGEDTLTVNVKYREQWSGKLPSRLHVMSNELPRLGDASAAIVGRLVLLVTERSWLGKENHKLERELRTELTGILNWALSGLHRLTFESEENQFTRVPESDAALQQLRDLSSPVGAFVREKCLVGLLEKDGKTERTVKVDDLYDAYRAWCTDNELPKSEKALFGRDLRAAYPFIKKTRPWAPPKEDRPHLYSGIRLRRFGDDDDDDGVGDDQGALL